MSKKVSKTELEKLIKDTAEMEIRIQQINRDQTDANKNIQLSEFIRDAKTHIKDQRDVLLISIKVK